MNIQAKKLELVQRILNTSKSLTLMKVEKILKEEESDWWNEIGEEERQSIEKGISEADKGEFIPHSEVMKEIRERFKAEK